MKPVIIDRPALQTPLQRVTYGSITFIFWIVWLYLWLPVISLVAWLVGIKLFRENLIDNEGYHYLLSHIELYVSIILLIAVTQIGWSRYNLMRFRNNERRTNVPTSDIATHARDFNIDPQRLSEWQPAKNLVIHLSPRGDIIAVDTTRPAEWQIERSDSD